MLKKVLDDGGETDTSSVSKELGITLQAIHVIGGHLCSRGFLRKRVERSPILDHPGLIRKKSIWTIREQKRQKAISMVKEAYGENYEGGLENDSNTN